MSARIQEVIEALVAARRQGRPVDAAPLADALGDADAAYAVQAGVARTLGWFGGTLAPHWKSGGPSRQATPGHSGLPPAGVRPSPADLSDLRLRIGHVEAELALRLGRDVDAALAADLDMDTASELVDAMAVSIELVDSRWSEGLAAPALLRLADLQCHGALVLGEWVPYARRDWSTQRCTVTIGDQSPQAFTGSHACGDPAWVLPAWLRHLTRGGARVPAGTVVTTGTWCGLLPAAAGQAVHVAFEGIGEARLSR